MKKFIFLLLAILALTLVSCGGREEPEAKPVSVGEWQEWAVSAPVERYVRVDYPFLNYKSVVHVFPLPEHVSAIVYSFVPATIYPPLEGLPKQIDGCFVIGFLGPTTREVTFSAKTDTLLQGEGYAFADKAELLAEIEQVAATMANSDDCIGVNVYYSGGG